MNKNLVIVESPAKAKTIEKFLGKEYKVMSSYGHIRDLKENELSIDVEHNFAPSYIISPEKKKLVSELKEAASGASEIYLASDEDREGEAIAWHLFETLGLSRSNSKRIVFHEITKTAILKALEHPRDIDMHLVDAQQARRVLDRIVGFEVSPVLWRKVKPALSAGRVQSVAVRLIVEREREIGEFETKASYVVSASFILPDGSTILTAKLSRRLKDKQEAEEFLATCRRSSFTIEDIQKKPFRKSPSPPFTTSTLQQEAARKLGFTVSQTMSVAQKLYEAGHITYMRTDSVNLSDLALGTSKEAILKTYGERYYKFRKYQTKSKGAQEAHEAIRPTYMSTSEIGGTHQERRLYDLIYKRTIACQMSDAELERTTITINISNVTDDRFVASGEVVTFDGFLHVYKESTEDETDGSEAENGLLPIVVKGSEIVLKEMQGTERFTQRPPRYTEASLVHRLEELGIGRPSTYAPTIHTIQARNYVLKGDRPGIERDYNVLTLSGGVVKDEMRKETIGVDRNKLIPTDIGLVVNDFLVEHFSDILDYNFTASVEKEFDTIADGKLDWTEMMRRFYATFHPTVEAATSMRLEHRPGERSLGYDPKSGKPVTVKIGRYGPLVQIGSGDPNNKKLKPQFASLLKGQSIETITLEEALKLFELPRFVGKYEGDDIFAGIGRFGPYIRHKGSFVSIPKQYEPLSITLEESVSLIEGKREKEQARSIKKFDSMEIINGRFGPYLTCNGSNYRIPKGVDASQMSEADCLKLIADSESKQEKTTKAARRSRASAVASKSATAKTAKKK
jgi:DNA topoisomerase-1